MFNTNAIKSVCVKKDSRKPVNSMARSYLKPEYDSRASFYNKAETDDDKLYSYGTLVAEIINGKPVLYDDWDYSQTTIRHVREFLRQHGFYAESKSQIARDYLTNSRKAIKSGLLDETKGQQVEQFREEIRKDVDTALNEICYNYQEKLGITTGDSWEELDIDYVTENIMDVLKDQLINFM